jgi:hypothetical protein
MDLFTDKRGIKLKAACQLELILALIKEKGVLRVTSPLRWGSRTGIVSSSATVCLVHTACQALQASPNPFISQHSNVDKRRR